MIEVPNECSQSVKLVSLEMLLLKMLLSLLQYAMWLHPAGTTYHTRLPHFVQL